jgi:hypothetical protein
MGRGSGLVAKRAAETRCAPGQYVGHTQVQLISSAGTWDVAAMREESVPSDSRSSDRSLLCWRVGPDHEVPSRPRRGLLSTSPYP